MQASPNGGVFFYAVFLLSDPLLDPRRSYCYTPSPQLPHLDPIVLIDFTLFVFLLFLCRGRQSRLPLCRLTDDRGDAFFALDS